MSRCTIAVAVEADQAGLGDTHIGLVEAVERPRIADQRPALGLEHLPDRPVFELGVGGGLGMGDTAVGEPAVQLRQGLEPKPRREESCSRVSTSAGSTFFGAEYADQKLKPRQDIIQPC
jgi:hypothetical protein